MKKKNHIWNELFSSIRTNTKGAIVDRQASVNRINNSIYIEYFPCWKIEVFSQSAIQFRTYFFFAYTMRSGAMLGKTATTAAVSHRRNLPMRTKQTSNMNYTTAWAVIHEFFRTAAYLIRPVCLTLSPLSLALSIALRMHHTDAMAGAIIALNECMKAPHIHMNISTHVLAVIHELTQWDSSKNRKKIFWNNFEN